MATVTLGANANISALTFANNDTIALAGFTLNFDVSPSQTGVSVTSVGSAGKITLGAPSSYPLTGWQFTAGTGPLLASLAAGKSFGGNATGGTASGAHAVAANYGNLTGNMKGGSAANACGCYINYSTGVIAGTLTGGSANTAYGTLANEGKITGGVVGGSVAGAHGVSHHRSIAMGLVTGGSAVGSFGIDNCLGVALGGIVPGVGLAIGSYGGDTILLNGPLCQSVLPASLATIYSLFGPISPLATVNPGTQVIVLSGDVSAAIALGNQPARPTRIAPSVAPRLAFRVLNSDGTPVTGLVTSNIASAGYVTITAGVRSSSSSISIGSKVPDTTAHSTGQLVTLRASAGLYAIDAPTGAALATADHAELVVTLVDGTRLVYPALHPIDVATSTRNATTPPTAVAIAAAVDAALLDTGDATDLIASIVARIGNTNVDETVFITAIKAALFDESSIGNKLSVNASGQIPSSNMRGTDGAMLATSYTAPLNLSQTQAAAAEALTNYDPPTRAEATSDKGEVIAAVSGGISSGPNHVQFTVVNDETDAPIESVEVWIKRPGGSGHDVTDVDGLAEFACQGGVWTVLIDQRGYASTVTSIEVDGDVEDVIRLTPIEVAGNVVPGLCGFRILFVRLDGTPIVGAAVRAVLSRERQCFDGGIAMPLDESSEDPLTDASGVVTLLLVQGMKVFFTVDGVAESVRTIVTVPSELNAEMTCQR